MSDWEDLETEAREYSTHRGPKCGVAVFLDDLGEEFGQPAVESVTRTMANHRLTSTSIRRALGGRLPETIILPSTWTIQRHRTKRCGCKQEG